MVVHLYAKQANVAKTKSAPEEAGDSWTWTAIDADTKMILTWLVGPRDLSSAYAFMWTWRNGSLIAYSSRQTV